MNRPSHHSDPLDRLLRSAARAREVERPIAGLTWASENQILGAWRASRSGSLGESWMGLFRTGVALAGATALLTVLITWHTDVTPVADEVAATDAAFNVVVLR